MKRIFTLLLFPVSVFAQVSISVEPVLFVSPGNDQTFLRVEFTSNDPVRIEECTIDFTNDRIFDFVDRLSLWKDDNVLPVLSHASEFLFNPWTHYPSVYVGIGDDTVTVFDYKIDMYRHYSNSLQSSISCRVNYYAEPNVLDTILGPIEVSSSTVLDVLNGSVEDVISVKNIPGGLSIDINARFCEPFIIRDMTGNMIHILYESEDFYVPQGVYIVSSLGCEYEQKYIVQ